MTDIFELEEFTSDDKKHHVIWADAGQGYPVWFCDTHKQPYFSYCLEQEFLLDSYLSPKT